MSVQAVGGRTIEIAGRLVKTASLAGEWFEDLDDPASFIHELRETRVGADLFTFWQRLPQTEPRFDYHCEKDSIAVLPVSDFDHWWTKQINSKTRNVVRKAKKKGVDARVAPFDDEFVEGITSIFNETPIRQNKPFWHYGKSAAAVGEEMGHWPDKSTFIGAYLGGELIGFAKMLDGGPYTMLVEILSKIAHRDKCPTNALISCVVRLCEEKRIPYLVYSRWPRGSLADFKRHNGFQKIDLPRYFVPLTLRGKAFLKVNLHRGLDGILSPKIKDRLINMRSRMYAALYPTAKKRE